MIIDAHQHFWQLSHSTSTSNTGTSPAKPGGTGVSPVSSFNYDWLNAPALAKIRHDFLPSDLRPLIDAAGVDRTVFVQTQHNLDENRWVLGLAEQHSFIAGVVGWVDLVSNDCERQVSEFKHHPKFVGVRHIVQDEPDDDFLIRDDVLRGLAILQQHAVPYDLLLHVRHLRHVPTLARKLPELRMVIDHLAKPRIKLRKLDEWLPHFRAAAACPNVYCKLSGMVTEADWQSWTVDDLRPYVDAAVELFGPSRLMFGSDWPVCELAASYQQVHDALQGAVASLSPAEKSQIFGETAAEFYRL